jgi:peroxiredoxin
VYHRQKRRYSGGKLKRTRGKGVRQNAFRPAFPLFLIKPMKNFNTLIIIAVFLVSVFSFVLIKEFTKEDPLLKEAEAFRAKQMPKMPLQNIANLEDYSDAILQGDVFFVYALSTCDACKKELKLLSQSRADLESKTKIFAVMSEDEEVVREYIRKNNIEIPVLIDKDAKLLRELDLKYFPSNFKLNDGVIKKVSFGFPGNLKGLTEIVNY